METINPIKERLVELCNTLGITPNQFSLSIGMCRDYVRNIKCEVGTETLRNICNKYPDVNIRWIITGEGGIILTEEYSNRLTLYLKEENKILKEEVKSLIKENAYLEAKMELYSSNQIEAIK